MSSRCTTAAALRSERANPKLFQIALPVRPRGRGDPALDQVLGSRFRGSERSSLRRYAFALARGSRSKVACFFVLVRQLRHIEWDFHGADQTGRLERHFGGALQFGREAALDEARSKATPFRLLHRRT